MSADTKSSIEDFKEKCKAEGEALVKNVFPTKFQELQGLLESSKFQLSRVSGIAVELNIPCPDPVLVNNHISGGEPQAKKKRLNDSDLDGVLNHVQGSKVMLLPNGPAECNTNLVELIDVIKPHIVGLIDHANKIKMWITYMVPRIEDGNNFGVSIQEETLAEARQVESEAATYLDQISRYFMTRGKIVAKVAKYPHVTDIRRTVQELDEKEFISLRLIVHELRNNYVSLHDMIMKNLDKIKKPRNSNAEAMY